MAFFPKIQSPCPYMGNMTAIMDGDMCRVCKRQVFDLTDWSDGERTAFLSACDEEVCVSYRLPVRPGIAAAALVAAFVAAPTAAMAQAQPAPVPEVTQAELAAQAAAADLAVPDSQIVVVVGGGIIDRAHAIMVEVPADDAVPPLPVVYEDPPAPMPQARPAAPAKSGGN